MNDIYDWLALFIYILIILAVLYTVFEKIIWVFRKKSYWYYWRYWNPFTYVFYKRYTSSWFSRILVLPLFYASFYSYNNRYEDPTGKDDALALALLCFILGLLWYAILTGIIAREDNSELDTVIKQAKKHSRLCKKET